MSTDIIRFEMATPEDTGQLEVALERANAARADRLAIVLKTEGTATINDFGRSLALRAIETSLDRVGVTCETQVIISMGCEGLISPGGYLIVEADGGSSRFPGLVFGSARSPVIAPSDLINEAHIEIAENTVSDAISSAGITGADVALVLLKTPLLKRETAGALPPRQRGAANSSSLARGTAALGAAVALGEIERARLSSEVIGTDLELYSRRTMVFSGTETPRCEVIVLGNRGLSNSVRSGQIRDLIDIDSMARVIAGDSHSPLSDARELARTGRLAAVFLKAGVSPDGRLRGNRTTVFSSDLDPDKHMRAAASGVLGALTGDTRAFISGGAEHQAPAGGGLIAAIVASE